MIRINLLERPKEKPKQAWQPSLGGLPGIASALIVVLSLAFLGFQWYDKSSRIDDLHAQSREADEKIRQLEDTLRMIKDHQALKVSLEQRVEKIAKLKREQRVPVRLLDQVSRQIPDSLWLEGIDEREGAVQLRGKATTYTAVSEFYNNLKNSAFFGEVTLGNTQRAPEGVSFQLSCQFKPAVEDEPKPAAPAPKAPRPVKG